MFKYKISKKSNPGICMRNLAQELRMNKGIGPGFHFLRHVLSVVILMFHSYVLTFGGNGNIGYTKGDLVATASALSTKQFIIELLRPGLFSLVGAFFVLSGFLVAGSALRTRQAGRFLWFRLLRIVPALSVEVTLSALVLGTIFTHYQLRDYFTDSKFFMYFGNIIGAISFTLPGVFTDNPMPFIVNANLWTLPAEFYCYAIMIALMVTGFIFERYRLLLLFVIVFILIIIIRLTMPSVFVSRVDTTRFTSWFIVYLFFIGNLFCLFSDKIILNKFIFIICAISYFTLMIFRIFDPVAGILLAYCVVYAGMTKFPYFEKVVKGDYSYGIYLYGYPITQAIVAMVYPSINAFNSPFKLLIIMSLSVATTIAFAYWSWNFVEKRMLRLKQVEPLRRLGVLFS